MNIVETYNMDIVEAVMSAEIKTNPATILISPKFVADENGLTWEGHSDIRCKGCGTTSESRAFIISVLETIITHLQDE